MKIAKTSHIALSKIISLLLLVAAISKLLQPQPFFGLA